MRKTSLWGHIMPQQTFGLLQLRNKKKSDSLTFDKSEYFSVEAVNILKTVFLPIPKKADVVLHPVNACADGKISQITGNND